MLSCSTSYAGSSPITYMWMFSRTHSKNESPETSVISYEPSYKKLNANQIDTGNYTCRVKIDMLESEKTIAVEVLAPATGSVVGEDDGMIRQIISGVAAAIVILLIGGIVYSCMSSLKNKQLRIHAPSPHLTPYPRQPSARQVIVVQESPAT